MLAGGGVSGIGATGVGGGFGSGTGEFLVEGLEHIHVVVVISGSGTTGVGELAGVVVVIVWSGSGAAVVGQLARTVLVVGRITGEKVLVTIVRKGAGSTGV